MDFKSFVDAVQARIEADHTGEPVDLDRDDATAGFTLGTTRAQLALEVADRVYPSVTQADGSMIMPRHSESVPMTEANVESVARFFASGGTSDL